MGANESRIVTDPAIAFGVPTVRGTRIWVALIVGLTADGVSREALLSEYPQLTDEDITACLAHSERSAKSRFEEVPS